MDKVLNEIKMFITKPVTNLMKKEQEEEIKVSAIKTLVVALVAALIFVLVMIGVIEASLKAYSTFSLFGGADALNQAKSAAYAQADLFGWFIKIFLAVIVAVVVIAGVLFIVAKLLKVNKEFKNSLALAANYAIYLAVGFVFYYIFSLFAAPVAGGILIVVSIFASYAIKYAYKNSLGEGIDDDKLTIFATIVVSVVTIVVAIILGGMIYSSYASIMSGASSSITKPSSRNVNDALNSLNSLTDLLK